jgi:hypothetical protein
LLEAKPILAGLFGAAVSGLLLTAVIYSQMLGLPSPTETATAPAEKAVLESSQMALGADQPASVVLTSSTNPVVDLGAPEGLFDGSGLKAQPAGMTLDNK